MSTSILPIKAPYTHYQRGSQIDVHPQTEGGFALMGGGPDVDQAFQWMAEKGGQGDFLVLRASGGDGYQDYLADITDCNSIETLVLHEKSAAYDPFVLERVKRADAIFLAGGDQSKYVQWKDSPLLSALNQAILNNVPLGGTSAGLAVLGEHVFMAKHDTITSAQALLNPYDPKIDLESDFLQAPPLEGLITDSHFSERDRMGRLTTFMARLSQDGQLPEIRGVGVDESTAALVDVQGQAEIVGRGEVHWVLAQSQPEVCESGKPLTYSQLKVTSTQNGQTFDLNTFQSPEQKAKNLAVVKGILVQD